MVKQPKNLSVDEWMNKIQCIYTIRYYFSLKKEGDSFLLLAIRLVNLEDIILSEISQTQKDKYCIFPFI